MSLAQILSDYQSAVTRAQHLITSAHLPSSGGAYVWGADERTIITESAFLRIFIAWESLLEKCFIHYLMGRSSISGRNFTRYVNPRDEDHANLIFTTVQN